MSVTSRARSAIYCASGMLGTSARSVAIGLALMVSACGGVSPPPTAVSGSPSPSGPAPFATVAPASIDPFVASFLAANNATFDLQEPPPDVAISAARAIEIVASRTRGPIKKADAVFGVLHANLGAITPPRAWLVVLVGPGFVPQAGSPASSPNSAAASLAQGQNLYFVYAFVDAAGGSLLIAGGSSPPP
jgi:hypothetical protein